jgi:predicted HD phosphohydrolase
VNAPAHLPRATFTSMDASRKEDWEAIAAHHAPFAAALPDRVMAQMRLLGGDTGGFAVDRLQHSLQTAMLAQEAGEDDEYVVCALLHDIGDLMGPWNHADVGAAILQPFVSEANHWMVAKHGIFQGRYFFHHLGLDPVMRERFAGHPHFERTERFCARYDNPAFDPKRAAPALEHFEPLVQAVLAQPKQSLYRAEPAAA